MLQTNDYWIVCNRNGVVAGGTKDLRFPATLLVTLSVILQLLGAR